LADEAANPAAGKGLAWGKKLPLILLDLYHSYPSEPETQLGYSFIPEAWERLCHRSKYSRPAVFLDKTDIPEIFIERQYRLYERAESRVSISQHKDGGEGTDDTTEKKRLNFATKPV
jgi:hypothetical protein